MIDLLSQGRRDAPTLGFGTLPLRGKMSKLQCALPARTESNLSATEVIQEIKELLQNFIAPQLEAIRGDIKALDTKISAIEQIFDSKLSAVEQKLDSRLSAVEQRFDSRLASVEQTFAMHFEVIEVKLSNLNDANLRLFDRVEGVRRELSAEIRRVEETLSADFVRIESSVDLRLGNVDVRLTAMNEKIELVRREMVAEIKALGKIQPA